MRRPTIFDLINNDMFLKLATVLLSPFPSEFSVKTKSPNETYESVLSEGCFFLWKDLSLWVFPTVAALGPVREVR